MAKCTFCGTPGAYLGLTFVECLKPGCRFFSQSFVDDEKAHYLRVATEITPKLKLGSPITAFVKGPSPNEIGFAPDWLPGRVIVVPHKPGYNAWGHFTQGPTLSTTPDVNWLSRQLEAHELPPDPAYSDNFVYLDQSGHTIRHMDQEVVGGMTYTVRLAKGVSLAKPAPV